MCADVNQYSKSGSVACACIETFINVGNLTEMSCKCLLFRIEVCALAAHALPFKYIPIVTFCIWGMFASGRLQRANGGVQDAFLTAKR